MSVEGLHAWIAEVERKLSKRTRVFLALTVIAIGVAGASLYLAIDARNSSVSESDVQALQQKLETRIDELAAGGTATAPTVPPVETEPTPAPQPEESQPKSQGDSQKQNKSSSGGGQDKSAKILELLEQTKRQNAEAETGQNAK